MNDGRKADSKEKQMPFLEHLDELRRVIIDSLIAIAIASTACWFFSGRAIDLMVTPIGKAVFINTAEAFAARFELTVVLGLLISLPFVFYRVWRFVVPGLLRRERSLMLPFAVCSTLFFYGGVAFSYFMLVPAIVKLLLAFGTSRIQPMISINSYFLMVMQISIALGVVFQFPLVVGVLTWLGVITPGFLKRKWRYAVVIIFIVGAVVTPGDGPSQLVVAFPLCGLYFLSILISVLVKRRKERERESEDDVTRD
ncbi:MAG: twin-arginine translocase subunit TatC [Candidatus Eisenbacteria bacterium]|nr:twin-arginine translocase subunit TatC [Candidatus Eisenbacteria bacterium]